MPRRRASNGCALASVLIALVVAALPAAGGAQAAKGANEVVDGAKKIGKGVEETAKGIGKAVSEGAKEVGHRAAAAGKETKPAIDRMHDSAKGFGESIWAGMKTAGRSIKRFFTGS